jgi:flagellar hook protein FlgE
MSTSLFTGIHGLRVHQQLLDVVGNNLANTNTVGFKTQRARFADLLYQTLAPATGSTAQTGGTNPVQVGLGAIVAAIDANLNQGAIETTGFQFDLALQGQGFFVVNNGSADLFTRAGTFNVDQKNFLIDPGTGMRVQRTGIIGEATATTPAFQTPGDNDIQIPFGMGIPGQATRTINFRGNLSANAVGPLAQTLTSAQPFRSGGVAATLATALNALDSNTVDYIATDSLRISGTTRTGAAVNATIPLAGFFPPGPTVGNLITQINALFPGSTASLSATGNLIIQDNTTGPSQLSVAIADGTPAPPQIGATNWAAHTLALTTAGKDGDRVSTGIQVYDVQGTPHNLSMVFQKQAANRWDMTASIPAADGTMTDSQVIGILFNDNGSFLQVSGTGVGDGDITFQFTGLSAAQNVVLNLGSVNGFDGLTQFGGSTSAAAISQDGFAAGYLTAVSVAQDGVLNGVFTNGRSLALAQLAIANFANPGGLNREGDNLFTVSAQSGDPLIGSAQSGGRGSVLQGVLEQSNVDIAQEFTRLIVGQRGFQVNARTITVSDEVLEELASIVR